ncbi:MAG: anti-sigma regulatory factor [SAR202 cluster bacterium]|nr:anti-sigma regulatory factor [SAR202 cluster bacterium]
MLATNLGLDALDVALLMAATSELARGVLRHAGGGEMTFSQIARGWRRGLRIVASGKPATASREDALDITAYSSMQRVADEFGVRPGPGWAMVATAVKWLPRPLELALTGS